MDNIQQEETLDPGEAKRENAAKQAGTDSAEKRKAVQAYFRTDELNESVDRAAVEAEEVWEERLVSFFRTSGAVWYEKSGWNWKEKKRLRPDTLPELLSYFTDGSRTGCRADESYLSRVAGDGGSFESLVTRRVLKSNRTLAAYQRDRITQDTVKRLLKTAVRRASKESIRYLLEKLTPQNVLEWLSANPAYSRIAGDQLEKLERVELINTGILDRIPDRYPDLYPEARKLHRRFVLHIGPTNSGKTYEAMQAVRDAGAGIYLAPLRLLAYEQYSVMNRDGYRCSLITGEEELLVPGADFRASTIEMMPKNVHYPAAVIDEAQMLSDPERGSAWTAAILGLCADEIHVCMAPEAEGAVIWLIRQCGDEYRVVRHYRKTPLKPDMGKPFYFPESVQDGDALIVFSRKAVHAVASELREQKVSCSMIYGALPYDVRQNEADRFANGETKVVVATDAVGMGLNLPIRRIVFLETSKFDGVKVRPLKPQEVKQIAGRAGRYGLSEAGYYTAEGEDLAVIRELMKTDTEDITEVSLEFPESLLGIDAPLSEIIERWSELPANEGYRITGTEEMLALCREAEDYTDDKELIYRFITIPIDTDDELCMDIWLQMLACAVDGEKFDYNHCGYQFPGEDADIREYELGYRVCDLFFYHATRFGDPDEAYLIMQQKRILSGRIMDILSKEKLSFRKCRLCGKPLPWNYPFGVCDRCHRKERAAAGGSRGRRPAKAGSRGGSGSGAAGQQKKAGSAVIPQEGNRAENRPAVSAPDMQEPAKKKRRRKRGGRKHRPAAARAAANSQNNQSAS